MILDEAVATFKRELPKLVVIGERMLGVRQRLRGGLGLRNAFGHHPDLADPRGDLPAWWLPPDAAHIVMVIAILWAILAAVLLYVVVAYRARRMYCQYKAIQEPMTVELVDEGLRLGSGGAEAILP